MGICEGIAIAKSQGKYKGRKAKAVDDQLWGELYLKWAADEITAVEFMRRMGMSKSAFYRRVEISNKPVPKNVQLLQRE